MVDTTKRILIAENYVPEPGYLYKMDIDLGLDSAGGFPQIQGDEILVKTSHVTPGIYKYVVHVYMILFFVRPQ